MTPFELFLLSVLILSLVFGFLAVFFNFFGTWIIFLGALFYAYQTHFAVLSLKMIALLGGIALAGEILENLLAFFGIKKMGGGNRSVAGAFIGGIAGGLLGTAFLGVGVIPGALLGIFLGAFLLDLTRSGNLVTSMKVGLGGVFGAVSSVFVKLFAALLMIQMIVLHIWKS